MVQARPAFASCAKVEGKYAAEPTRSWQRCQGSVLTEPASLLGRRGGELQFTKPESERPTLMSDSWGVLKTGNRLLFVLKRFIRIRWRWRDGARVQPNLFLQEGDRGVELGVTPGKGGVGKIIHNHVGINAVAFDEPLPLRAVDAIFGGRRDAGIG